MAIPVRPILQEWGPRRSPITRRALVAGLLLTIVSFMSVFVSGRSLPTARVARHEAAPSRPIESLQFVTTEPRISAAAPIVRRGAPAISQRRNDSTAAHPAADVVVAPVPAAEVPTPTTNPLVPQASRLSLPSPTWRTPDFTRPNGVEMVAPRGPLTAMQRDSANKAFARAAAARILSAEEKDSIMRAMSGPGTIPGRPAGAAGSVGGGMDTPISLFTPGPSRTERKRDSIALAENLERLARLRARMQAKRDSTPR